MHPLIEKYIASNNFGKHLGMQFEVIEPGKIGYHLKVQEQHLATPQAAHGGVISGLMDGMLGVAGLSAVCIDNNVVSTIEFKINYFNPALLNDDLVGIAEVIKQGKRILICEGTIRAANRQDIIIAKAMGTFNVYPAEKAGY